MPNKKYLSAMASVAHSTAAVTALAQKEANLAAVDVADLDPEAYSGEDRGSFPYAQLTQAGADQLVAVGQELRKRYFGDGSSSSSGDIASSVQARSTNMCRTLQSLRSLLVGLLGRPIGAAAEDTSSASASASASAKVTINTRPKAREVMFPTADGPCEGLAARRATIFPPDYMARNLPGFVGLEERVRAALGFDKDKEKPVGWLTVKEILTCRHVHGLELPGGLSQQDEEQITQLAGWMWGVLHNDAAYNRLAIGRFLGELLADIQASDAAFSDPQQAAGAAPIGPRMLIYSGHDSTLVPLLCALGCYDGVWPPYASFLSFEVVRSRASGERFVRAVYNDKQMPMTSCLGDGAGGEMWCPLPAFLQRLREMAVSTAEYKEACKAGGAPQQAAQAAQAEAEVKATIG